MFNDKAIFIDRDGIICEEKNLFYQGNYKVYPDFVAHNLNEAFEIIKKQ